MIHIGLQCKYKYLGIAKDAEYDSLLGIIPSFLTTMPLNLELHFKIQTAFLSLSLF